MSILCKFNPQGSMWKSEFNLILREKDRLLCNIKQLCSLTCIVAWYFCSYLMLGQSVSFQIQGTVYISKILENIMQGLKITLSWIWLWSGIQKVGCSMQMEILRRKCGFFPNSQFYPDEHHKEQLSIQQFFLRARSCVTDCRQSDDENIANTTLP